MHELIYMSIETRQMSDQDLLDLLSEAREKNERLGITGLLFYYKKEFVQILEGEKEAIFSLFDTIRLDKRHRGVELFWDAPIDNRGFHNWSMGFAANDQAKLLGQEGYANFVEDGIASVNVTEHPNEGRTMMLKLRDLLLNGQ